MIVGLFSLLLLACFGDLLLVLFQRVIAYVLDVKIMMQDQSRLAEGS
jgi:hypothetical protein